MPSYKTAAELPHKGTLTLAEAALETGLSQENLRRMVRSGELTGYLRYWRYGVYEHKAYFIPITDLKRFMIERAAKHLLGKHGLKQTNQSTTPLA